MRSNQVRDFFRNVPVRYFFKGNVFILKIKADFIPTEIRPPEAPFHKIIPAVCGPLIVQILVPCKKSRTDGASRITGSRLYPDVFKRPFPKDSAVADAIECDTTRKTEIFLPRFAVYVLRHAKHHLFRHVLNRAGQIHIPLRDIRFRLPGRTSEQPVEFRVRHGQPCAVIKIIHIQSERPVLFEIHQFRKDQVPVYRPSIRRQSHDLIFA